MLRAVVNDKRKYNTIDLFCGAGGLSLGAARAGLRVVAGVDNDKRAILAHAKNFPKSKHIKTDIKELRGKTLLDAAMFVKNEVEAIIGGPPCQGFSRIGKRDPGDPRNSLLYHFLRIVSEIRPRFFVLENVPGILDNCFDRLRTDAFAQIKGYKIVGPAVLKASDFGAATSRERVFFVGYLPKFYRDISLSDFTSGDHKAQIDVQLALKGLRKAIKPTWQDEKQGWRVLTLKPKGVFWKKVFGEFPSEVGDAYAISVLEKQNLVSGCLGTAHSPDVLKRYRVLSEGAVDRQSRAIRLKRCGFCPTLRAGTGSDHGSFQALRPIHPTEHRVITPREAARLQGFPDWFQFDSTKWHSFRQIGNSVSPIVGEAVFKKILAKQKP
jgi:DNA (cytosine-5)-methyltransferase 1